MGTSHLQKEVYKISPSHVHPVEKAKIILEQRNKLSNKQSLYKSNETCQHHSMLNPFIQVAFHLNIIRKIPYAKIK